MSNFHRLGIGTVLLVSVFILSGRSTAAQSDYPAYEDVYVNDYASVITSDHESQIRALLTDLYEQEGIEATVLTINSITDYDVGAGSIEAFATGLFNEWGIGSAARHDGVLLLVAVADRELRIEVGTRYESTKNETMKGIIDNVIVPYFQDGEMSLGIYAGVQAIVADLTAVSPANASQTSNDSVRPTPVPRSNDPASPQPVAVNPQRNLTGTLTTLLSGGAVVSILGLIFGVPRYRRYRKRNCPQCQTQMERLDEHADDTYLEEGQRAEERIGSVDYDIWRCPSCHHHELNRYGAIFSRYKRCPKCSYRTLSTSSTITQQPTYTSTGTQRIRQSCRHCSYDHVSYRTLPRRVRDDDSSSSFGGGSRSSSSSSGSSSSFGGGSSSGSGASGKW